jgi:hypothetical protein
MRTKKSTSQAKRTYRVWADYTRRMYQEVKATSPQKAHEIARSHTENWEDCFECEDRDDYRLSPDVQDVATDEFITVAKSEAPFDNHTPWTAELVKSGFDAGFHQVVNSEGWVIATRLVYEDAYLLAAAPDIYALGKELLERECCTCSDEETPCLYCRFDAAVTKADHANAA